MGRRRCLLEEERNEDIRQIMGSYHGRLEWLRRGFRPPICRARTSPCPGGTPAVIQLHQRLRERGIAIDILINNAGHGLQGPFLEAPLDAALAMVQLDVASLTAVTHIFAQDMRTRGRGKILLVASLLAYQGVQNFAVYSAAKAYVLRLGEALHRELKRDGITVTALCPGMSDTGFATAAQQKITSASKLLMMQPAPVVRAGIRALHAGRMSVVPGLANMAMVIFSWATPRWFHQAIFFRAMNA